MFFGYPRFRNSHWSLRRTSSFVAYWNTGRASG